ncbi:hypothetical protein KZH41_16145 [Pseudomonas sp. YeP6b]|uniref:hypothetical protein n=1 Tax=Pseudomonas sp. YeP6b TaxID=2861775 RepID=UPI0021D9C5DB|nr:hypothetical protein [Pseudomonas sp. YeP6b]UXZ20086.1 hypothetical protein KZH41_16145 [Pseudomonas sp. YeP6b]
MQVGGQVGANARFANPGEADGRVVLQLGAKSVDEKMLGDTLQDTFNYFFIANPSFTWPVDGMFDPGFGTIDIKGLHDEFHAGPYLLCSAI